MTHTRCSRCVLSASFPSITFDAQGVCAFCNGTMFTAAQPGEIERAGDHVRKLLADRPKNSDYDGLMCFSGGKDSTYTLMLAVKKYGLKLLAFTLDNGYIAAESFDNMRRITDLLGVDHLILRPAAPNMRAIIRASALHAIYHPRTLLRISAICNSCITMVNTIALQMAVEKRIPFIIAGFTLGQIPAKGIYFVNNYTFLEESRQTSLQKLQQHAGPWIEDYFRLPAALVKSVVAWPTNINLLCLENVTEEHILQEVKKLDWVAPKDVDGCSSNCRLNSFNNQVHEMVFDYSPYELELSHLVRSGLLPRDEAIRKLNDSRPEQFTAIAAELGISMQDIAVLREAYKSTLKR